jgi:hypothetical protein
VQAVGNEPCCETQIHWLFNNTRRAPPAEDDTRECHTFPHTDFDGFAVTWGSANVQTSAEDCCQSCLNYKPVPPSYYPCNIWYVSARTPPYVLRRRPRPANRV